MDWHEPKRKDGWEVVRIIGSGGARVNENRRWNVDCQSADCSRRDRLVAPHNRVSVPVPQVRYSEPVLSSEPKLDRDVALVHQRLGRSRMFCLTYVPVLLLFQSGLGPTDAPALAIVTAQPAPELNALFERPDGWIGGDGVSSVPLAADRILWLFADTWVGKIKGGERTDATIVNNTAVIQEGAGKSPGMRFFIRRDATGKARGLLTPRDGGGWFWPQAGALHRDRLYVFLTQVEKSGEPGAFGFRLIGQWLAIVSNPLDAPTQWQVKQKRLPCAEFRPDYELTLGAALLTEGKYLYIYGVADQVEKPWRHKKMVVARAPLESVADFSTWRFYTEGRWGTDHRQASRLVDGLANDYSVSYHRTFGCYVLVYTENGLSPRILCRTANAPWGPWSTSTVVYKCPEAGWDKRIFCYAAKAHPELAKADELVISYVANSFDFWQVAVDARLYWPKFIRVKLRSPVASP
jgi:hypothetical protein